VLTPSPLYELKLRTPRLELRLPTRDEIMELARLAERGIHPPAEMPFQVPWTDWIGNDEWPQSFVDFHEQSVAEIWPESWRLELVTFLGGTPIGTQGIRSDAFAETRTVETGSWLGRELQRRGYGTEQRIAALALAFEGLGARAAISGALEGNVASARVSEKLGYAITGVGSVAPRGTPVPHTDFRLEREAWEAAEHPAVEILGLERCRPLLGAI
jgi:RimJ/RimL family protein N-acetyltransferase